MAFLDEDFEVGEQMQIVAHTAAASAGALAPAVASEPACILNLDGPKFKFVFGEMIGFFQQALKGAGVDDQLAHNVLLQFGDLVKMNEENLRRELSGNSIG